MQKLYVVVRKDLTKSQQAVQAGHALAEYLLKNKCTWDNGTLVYLGIKDKHNLKSLTYSLFDNKIDYELFCEPDLDGEPTALASLGNNEYFEDMRLL